MTRKTNQAGVDLIQKDEDCRLYVYNDSYNYLSYGFGTRVWPKDNLKLNDVITQEFADEKFAESLSECEKAIDTRFPGLNDNQFAAMVSFAYNVGIRVTTHSHLSDFIDTMLQKDSLPVRLDIANEFTSYIHANGQISDGLVKRRNDEIKLFFTPVN